MFTQAVRFNSQGQPLRSLWIMERLIADTDEAAEVGLMARWVFDISMQRAVFMLANLESPLDLNVMLNVGSALALK